MRLSGLKSKIEELEKRLTEPEADYVLCWTCEHGTTLDILNDVYVEKYCSCYDQVIRGG